MGKFFLVVNAKESKDKNFIVTRLYDLCMYGPIVISIKDIASFVKESSINLLSIDEATKNYKNATNSDWIANDLYIRHPRRNDVLISAKDYKDYILREMLGDICDYIMDNIPAKRIVAGVLSSKQNTADLGITIKSINPEAKYDAKLSKRFIVSITEPQRGLNKNDYVWIDKFPDIKNVIDRGATQYENIKEANIAIDLNISEKILNIFFKFSHSKKTQIYIYYCQ